MDRSLRWLSLLFLVAVAAQSWLIVTGPAWLDAKGVEAVEREQQVIASLVAGEVEATLADVRRRQAQFHGRFETRPPREAELTELIESARRPWDADYNITWFVQHADGRIIDFDEPSVPSDLRERFAGHRHTDRHERGPPGAIVCDACLNNLGAVSVSTALGSGLFVTTNIDVSTLAGRSLGQLSVIDGGRLSIADSDEHLLLVHGPADDATEPAIVTRAAIDDHSAPWTVIVSVPRSQIMPGIESSARALLLGSTTVLAVMVLLVFLFMRRQRALERRLDERSRELGQTYTELEVAEQRHESLFHSSRDAIYFTDLEGTIIEANPHAERLFGYPAGGLVGVSVVDLHPVEHRPGCARAFGRLLREGQLHMETQLLRKSGEELTIDIRASLVEVRGERTVFSIARDVTERRETEAALADARVQFQQAQKMEAVGRLAGGIAHDFNNLLSVIILSTTFVRDSLKRNQVPADCPCGPRPECGPVLGAKVGLEDLNDVLDASQRATALVRQLLVFSRKQIVKPVAFDMCESVEQFHKGLARFIGEHVDMRLHRAPRLPKIRFDKGQLEQVLMNLAVNARDAMPKGGRLDVSFTLSELDGFVLMTCSDNGCGMSEETAERIFEPFFTTKGPGSGTGLGLSTVYGIMSHAGGRIEVESKLGEGTLFRLHFPIATSDTPAAADDVAVPEPMAGVGTIVVVEDEPAVRKAVARTLTSCGYSVLVASNGAEALDVIAAHDGDIDLLLTDVVMPVMGGAEVAERFAILRPGARVLFMSGYTDDAVIRHGVAAGSTALLQKPVSPQQLAQRVHEVLHSEPYRSVG